jgi:sec-independent protein translocase protein TatC
MDSSEDPKGAPAPPGESAPLPAEPQQENSGPADTHVTYAPVTDTASAYDDPYTYGESSAGSQAAASSTEIVPATSRAGGSGGSTPPPPPTDSDGGDDEDGMLRMSFLEHLEELRSRILRALAGVGVAFVLSLTFCNELWRIVSAPAVGALKSLGYKGFNGGDPALMQIAPMDYFNIVWVKLPILTAIFIASPWILYQVWAFIAPGLYKRERRWAAPFVICSAGLFIMGGLFGYFVAFRYGLTFLLGLGRGNYVMPMVSMTEYFDLFVDVILGIGLVFEMPVLIFFLTLLHIASPRFLIKHSRYAILGITILAAVVTPTPDIFNMMLFAVPMCALFYLGILASYLLVLHREERKFPWRKASYWIVPIVLLLAAAGWVAVARFGYHFVTHWPFITR